MGQCFVLWKAFWYCECQKVRERPVTYCVPIVPWDFIYVLCVVFQSPKEKKDYY